VLSVSNHFSFDEDQAGGGQVKADRNPSSERQLGADEKHPSERQVAAKSEGLGAIRANSNDRAAGRSSRPTNIPRFANSG